MVSHFSQSARSDLLGPGFLTLLGCFRKERLAALYSGDLRGHSVIARKPLVTFTAADEHSPFRIQTASHVAPDTFPVDQSSILDAWESALCRTPIGAAHHPLTAWIGHFSFDLGRTLEPLPSRAKNDHAFPLLHWRLFEEYFLFDHAAQRWTAVVTTCPGFENAAPRLDAMQQVLLSAPPQPAIHVSRPALLESMPRDAFLLSIERIKTYIAAGDIFQANFSQRWKFHTGADPIDIFENLMRISPSAYAALLIDFTPEGTMFAAVSASPELLLQCDGPKLLTRPIKGTRPRDLRNPARDEQLRMALLHSEKDRAELTMIVDLLRNDLGRVANYGSVRVATPRAVEALPTLWHAHSDIEATLFTPPPPRATGDGNPFLDPRLDTRTKPWASLIRAIFPGGSVTGAPKIRATHIIEELEPYRRGLYCGTIGAVSPAPESPSECAGPPTATFNLAIRTMQMIGNTLTLHAGAGIVADSEPAAEYEETLDKARALLRAISWAE